MLTLYEDYLGEFNALQNLITNWHDFNKHKIKIISAIYADSESYEKVDLNIPGSYKRCIRIRYEGEAGANPQKCKHEHLTETILVKPSCTHKGRMIIRCNDCGLLTEKRILDAISHDWKSNNDGTHTCINEDGCSVTEECYPNDYGDVCEKCGYRTPDDIVLEITTSFVNGMAVDNEFSQKLESNSPIPSIVTWGLTDGSLPDGITLSSEGLISGIPTEYGVFGFTVQATYHGQTASKTYSVNVAKTNFTVTFDYQDGTGSEFTRIVPQGSTIGTLPEATREDYIFGGWFTAPVGGLKVDENYSISSDVTLYARWGQGTDIDFGDSTSTFNIQYQGDRTNYQNNPYTIYHRCHDGTVSNNLITQVGIYSEDGTNNMSNTNKVVKLYLKVTNKGDAGYFDVGFDCDSYVAGDDCLYITRLANGVKLGSGDGHFTVTVPYDNSVWVGKYSDRTKNRYNDSNVGTIVGKPGDRAGSSNDTGYAFTMNNIFINSRSYVILETTFAIPE